MDIVTVAMGRKNSAGDWIVTERVESVCIPTSVTQIAITPCVPDVRVSSASGYNLTHVQSGYFLLGPFATIAEAQSAADILADILPVEDWNIMGQISRSWQRSQVKAMFGRLTPEQQKWMRERGAKL